MYNIKEWSKHFENNRSRDMKRTDWVPIPNTMDGSAYTEFMDHKNCAAHFGAWIAIVEIASRQAMRGEFPQLRAGIPQDDAAMSQLLSRISRIPVAVFLEVLPRLVSIGWIVRNQQLAGIPQDGAIFPHDTAGIPQDDASMSQDGASRVRALSEGKGREGKGMEWNGNAAVCPPQSPPDPIESKDKRGCKLDPRMRTPSWDGYATGAPYHWSATRVNSEFAAFCDHHAQRGTIGKDWLAGWRTWVRNGQKFNPGPQRPPELLAVTGAIAVLKLTAAEDYVLMLMRTQLQDPSADLSPDIRGKVDAHRITPERLEELWAMARKEAA